MWAPRAILTRSFAARTVEAVGSDGRGEKFWRVELTERQVGNAIPVAARASAVVEDQQEEQRRRSFCAILCTSVGPDPHRQLPSLENSPFGTPLTLLYKAAVPASMRASPSAQRSRMLAPATAFAMMAWRTEEATPAAVLYLSKVAGATAAGG